MTDINVTGPDGATFAFPEGTPEATISSAMQAHYGGQPPAPQAQSVKQKVSGSFLPISRDETGVHFDTNAGVIGAIKRALMLPGEVWRGEVDPKSDEGLARTLEMAGVVTPMSPALRAGERAIPGVLNNLRKEAVSPPTAEALKAAAEKSYEQARNLGVEYAPAAVKSLVERLQGELAQDGVIGELAPKSFGIFSKLANPPEGATAPLVGIEAARRSFGHAAKDFANPTEQLAARRAQEGLDQFVSGANPESVIAGDATKAASLLEEARGNYAASKRSNKITGIEDSADLNASAANSGANGDNALRQRLKPLLQNPKQGAGFNAEELAAIRGVIDGSRAANTARWVGNFLGGGGGLAAQAAASVGGGIGSLFGGWPGAAIGAALPPGIGAVSKATATHLTRNAIHALDQSVRARSPLMEALQQAAPSSSPSPEGYGALLRALLSGADNSVGQVNRR